MIDYVFSVDDPIDWHNKNISANISHYSMLARLGPSVVTRVQEYGAGIYYNPFVNINGQIIKYGVISHAALCKDLQEWCTFYVSGRMQKPVVICQEDDAAMTCNKTNLKHALAAAALLLPDTFDERSLYETIASLSYLGDVRMKMGENPRKVTNIVAQNMQAFRDLYKEPLSEEMGNIFIEKVGENFKVSKNTQVRLRLLQQMPATVQDNFVKAFSVMEPRFHGLSRNQILEEIVATDKEKQAGQIGIASIVKEHSRS